VSAGQEVIGDCAEAVLVSGRGDQFAGKCFRRHVHQGPDEETGTREALFGRECRLCGNAEIEEFYVFAPRIVHHIVRL
jgi:hypothetical protein